ncbi:MULTISPECIES: phage tail tape measure protein [unclassified Pseudomonas]|uniref:phage tail tape measure protein n=1 Tax=unclassified Pseudomonas TaxID=196821 RepID=UPI000CD0F144|nr:MULTISPECIES: phage tail tape measure protein [unclassified Pseudomonas]POA26328.1 phage tail tape measure protein [Pseudomonas sp. FW305-3-2-15-E-TSA4]POA44586.1 phage tail tape measure protein [Pseudomonas sp. FW305-3-2-15-E-TSA2]
MSTTFASLGIEVNSSSASKAADDLDKLVDSAVDAEKAIDDLGKSGEDLANTGKKISQAENEAAQAIDKANGAKERQVDASRKAGASAASEIAIISQLDKAMSGNIGSMEQLIQAEGLLERARKGGLVTIEQQESYQDRLGKAYERIEKAEAKEMAQKQRLIDAENRQIEALKRTVNGIDPVTAKLAKLEVQEKALNDLYKAGQIDSTRYGEALAKIGKDRDGLTATETAFDKLKLGTRQAQENVMQLTNALQSGDWGSGARSVAQLGAGAGASAKSLAAALIPAGLLAGVLGALGYAYFDAQKQAREFNVAINGGSNDAGQSIASLKMMADTAGAITENFAGAREAVIALASGAATSGVQMQNLAQAAAAIGEVTGKGAGDIAKSLANAGDTATEAAEKISDQYGLLTYEQYQTIKAIDDQGDHQRALDTLSEDLNQSAQERLKSYRESLSDIERDWDRVKVAIKGAYAEVRSEIFPDLAKQIEITQRVLDTRKGGGVAGALSNGLSWLNSSLGLDDGENDDSTPALEAKLAGLKARLSASESNTAATGEATRANKELIAVQKELDKQMDNLNPLAKRRDAYKKLDDQFTKLYQNAEKTGQKSALLDGVQFDGKKFSGGAYDQLRKAIDEQKKDPKAAAGSVDLSGFNDSKNALNIVLAEYKNAQKDLEASQKAGLISQADYLQAREAMIGNERDEVTAAYEAEIAALEAAKSKAGTSAAQRIQLDQKIADARAAMVKVQQDADTELSVLAKNEEGRLKKQTEAVNTYSSALQQQVKTLREQGQRAAAGIGLGDRQRDLVSQQNGIDDRFNQQRLDLANQYGDGSRGMSLDEYTQKLAALKATQQDLHDTVQANYDEMTAAQGDWSAGASSAWQNYLDSAQNAAGQTKSLLTNAFSSAEDAVASFAINGKFSFSDFTKSVLADMAKIATRQATSQGLSALFGIAASAAGSYFGGGGGNGLAAGSAGAVSSDLGASQAGYTGIDFSGYRAAGGPVAPNSLYEVNELGPELYNEGGRSFLMTGANGGSVTPLTTGGGPALAAMSGGGGNTYNFPVAVSVQTSGSDGAGVSQETTNQLGKSIQQAAKTEAETAIARALQPGGSIWRLTNGRA